MDAPSGVFSEIGAKQARGDDMAGVGLHRERQRGQGRLHERHIVVTESALTICRERIGDSCPLRAVALLAVNEELREIIRGALRVELLQNREIALLRTVLDAPAQRGGVLAGASALHQCVEGARGQKPLVLVAVGVILRLDGVEVAPPGVAIAIPLRMQRLHRGMRPPQRDPIDHQALTVAVKQMIGVGAAQSFAHRPDVGIDDPTAERVVECPVAQFGERLVATVLRHRADYGFASDFGTTNTWPGKMTLGLWICARFASTIAG